MFDKEKHKAKMMAIMNPEMPMMTPQGMPNMVEKVKQMAKKKK